MQDSYLIRNMQQDIERLSIGMLGLFEEFQALKAKIPATITASQRF